MASYLITGTSQGLGLALTTKLLSLPASQVSHIFALTRSAPSPDLQKLLDAHSDRSTSVIASVTDGLAIEAAAKQVSSALGDKGLDVLINNAGAADANPGGMRSVKAEQMKELFELNVVGVQTVTAAFLPLLEKGKEKKIVNLSTSLASISMAAHTHFAPTYAYKISKAAVNMLTVQYSLDLKDQGFTVFALTPGWLKTKLGGVDYAHLSVEQGAEEVVRIVRAASPEVNGKLLNIKVPGYKFGEIEAYDGGEIPW
ncbi:hypothetical protein LTR95_004708 [Oleoguttula sp. CCFEE 5521]